MKEKIFLNPILITVSALILIYTLAGFFLVPMGMKKALETAVDKTIAGKFSAESVGFNPYTLEGRIQGMDVRTREDDPFVRVDQIYVNISAASLFKLAPVIDAVSVDAPKITLATDKSGRLTGISLGTETEDKKQTEDGGIFGFRLANLSVSGGELDFTDGVRQVTHHLRGFSLDLPLVSTLEDEIDRPVLVNIGLVLNDARINADASLHPFGREIKGKCHVQGEKMGLKSYLSYVPLPPALDLTAPGILSWDMDLGIALPENKDLSKARISIRGRAGIKDMAADLRDNGPLARMSELTLSIDTKDLIAKGLELDLIKLDQPEVFVERDDSGGLPALAALTAGEPRTQDPSEDNETVESEASSPSEAASFSIALDKAEVTGGMVHIKDGVPENGFQTLLSPVWVQVENFSFQGKDLQLEAQGRVVTAAGETLALTARLMHKEDTTRIDGHLGLENGSPAAYGAYLTPFTKDRVAVEKIDASSDFSLGMGAEGLGLTTSSGALTLAGFRFGPPEGKAIISLPEASVKGVAADLSGRQLTIASMAAAKGKVAIGMDGKGEINLLEELAPLTPEKGNQTETPQGAPWQVFLGECGLADWQVSFKDDSHGDHPVHLGLSQINLSAKALSTAPKAAPGRITGGMKIQNTGRFNLAGTLDLAGKKAHLGLKLKDIGINTFEPYFTDYLKIEVADGRFGADTTLDLSFPEGEKLALRLAGKAGISDFSSKDKLTQNDFFRCKSLFVSGMDISLWPLDVGIKDLSLTDFYSRAILSEQGQLNLKAILAEADPGGETPSQPEPEESGAPAKEIPRINISNITLQGGHINFSDRFTRPNYTANMTQVAGRITNLSSTSPAPADLVLKGVHGLYSPLDITGKLQPFGQDRMADMNLSFKNIELTQFNAYAEKYLGYGIETGKLILTLEYHIQGNRLESSNRLFFDQFNLGEKVESETATGLPIQMAISLLKNSKDQIDLDIPVHGDLNDPAFSFGSVVATAFKNLIVSVVSAPFKLLGKVFGAFDSEELGYVEFNPGMDSLGDQAKTKLGHLATALSEKKALKFVIEGKYDPELDAGALRTSKYQATLLALVQGTKEAQLILEDPEKRLPLAEQLYAVTDFPKPRDEKGKEKKISPEEMEKLLLTNTIVTEADLLDLADRRGKMIMTFLAAQGSLDPNRLFLQPPAPALDEDRESQTVKTIFQVE